MGSSRHSLRSQECVCTQLLISLARRGRLYSTVCLHANVIVFCVPARLHCAQVSGLRHLCPVPPLSARLPRRSQCGAMCGPGVHSCHSTRPVRVLSPAPPPDVVTCTPICTRRAGYPGLNASAPIAPIFCPTHSCRPAPRRAAGRPPISGRRAGHVTTAFQA